MSTRRLLPDRLVTGATPARHRSARSSRRCTASNASASSVARTIRPTPGKDRRIVTSHGSGLCPSAPSCAPARLWVRRSSRSSTASICRLTRSSRLATASRWAVAALTVPGARGIAGVSSRSRTLAAESRRIERLHRAKAARVGAQRVAQHLRIPAIILGASRREAVAEAIELLGIDRVNAEATLHQALDDRAVRHLDGHEDRLGGSSRHLEDPSRHRGQTFAAVSERPRATLAAAGIGHLDVMRLGGPVDTHEPVALVLHRADPYAVGAAAMLTGPCTGAQGRRLPTGPPPRPLAGARVPPRCSQHRGWLVAPGKLARSDQPTTAQSGSR